MQDFTLFKMKPAVAQALQEMGFTVPTPIQAEALPVLLGEETDYLGLAATGTGKTAAFGIPLLDKIDAASVELQAVVLCPTRELCVQTAKQLTLLGKHLKVSVPAIYGGAGYGAQFTQLQNSPLIVATPGRLVDHLARGTVSLKSVKWLVLDEADRMISMGFKEELERILEATVREQCRTWLFSATMPPYLKQVAATYLKAPQSAQINGHEVLSGTVRQLYFSVRDKNKPKGLCKLIEAHDGFYGLVFCQTKALVMDLTAYLQSQGHHVDCLHGDKDQRDRERTLALFRERKVTILVCTDVAARGLDVNDLTHVINYSLPYDTDSYIHRIGRTGRNGKEGIAMSLVGPEQLRMIPRIEKRTRTKWEAATFPSRRDINAKKLARLLPRFEAASNHDKALAALGEEWTAKLEAMTKQEIASRFLALAHPEMFEEGDDAAVTEMPERRERFDRPQRFDRAEGPRRFDRGDRPQRFDRAEGPRRFDRGDRPQRFDRAEGPRRFDRGDRPQRFDRGDRPQRFDPTERPRPARPFERSKGAGPVHAVRKAAPTPPRVSEALIDVEAAEREFHAKQAPIPAAREATEQGKPFFTKKPFGKRFDKPFAPRGDKPFAKRFGKPFGPRAEKPSGKPFGKPFGKKPFGKPFGTGKPRSPKVMRDMRPATP